MNVFKITDRICITVWNWFLSLLGWNFWKKIRIILMMNLYKMFQEKERRLSLPFRIPTKIIILRWGRPRGDGPSPTSRTVLSTLVLNRFLSSCCIIKNKIHWADSGQCCDVFCENYKTWHSACPGLAPEFLDRSGQASPLSRKVELRISSQYITPLCYESLEPKSKARQ